MAAVVLTGALLAAGCGGGDKESEGSKVACKADATTAATGLPAGFPIPAEVTVTAVRTDGPSQVVDGYWAAALDEAYREYKEAVESADGYEILFTEQEEDDAEISYKGEGRSGQIALREDCSESDTTRVHITSRPE